MVKQKDNMPEQANIANTQIPQDIINLRLEIVKIAYNNVHELHKILANCSEIEDYILNNNHKKDLKNG